jgi:spermidine synthase
VEAKDIRLYLNEELQVSSLDEKHYHEALVLPAMELTKSREGVLILGGGDGLGLREVLKYPDVKHTDLVDIDQIVINIEKD